MSSDAVQMLHRVRKPTCSTIYVSINQMNHSPRMNFSRIKGTVAVSSQHILDHRNLEHLESMYGFSKDNDGVTHIMKTEYMKLYLRNLEIRERDRHDYMKNFIWYCRHEGHKVVHLVLDETPEVTDQITKATKLRFKNVCDGIEIEHNQALCDAEDIDDATADAIEKKIKVGGMTDQEKIEHEKRQLVKHYTRESSEPPKDTQ